MRVSAIIVAASFIAATCIGAVWFTDSVSLNFCFVAFAWIGFASAVIATAFLLAAVSTGRSRLPALTVLALVCGVACFFGIVLPANHFVEELAVANAKAYPTRIAPLLESYRKVNGSYPTSLDQLPSKPSLPRLMRRYGYDSHGGPYAYHSDGGHYSFQFATPGDFFTYNYYDSDTRAWRRSEQR